MMELFVVLAVFVFVTAIPAIVVGVRTFTDLGSARYARAMYQTHRPRAYRAIMARRDEMGRFARS